MSRTRATIWKNLIWRIVLLAFGGLGLGLLVGNPFAGVSVALAVVVCWQLLRIHQLDRWLHGARGLTNPLETGVWQPLYESIYRRHLNHRARRRELHQTLREFRDASHALPDGLVVIDEKGAARWFNHGAQKLLGLRAPQDFGRTITNLIRNPQFRRWLAAGGGPADEGEEASAKRLAIVSPVDPLVKIVFSTVSLGEDRSLLVARDVTMVHRLDEMRRDFVANVSHELRTPLTVVSGYLEAMGESLSSEWHGPVNQMSAQCKRMKELIDDLLVIARLESGERSREVQPVEIPGLVSCIAEEAEVESRGNHKIVCNVDSRANLQGVYKDLRVAFGNLVTNAIRYTPAGGTITLEWSEGSDGASFSVTDTGPGIPAKFLPRLTERFYRIDSERSRATGGTGLGLAIVKHVVSQHKGELVIESTVGTGSRFICRFPTEVIQFPVPEDRKLA